jgi:hypothetical protein
MRRWWTLPEGYQAISFTERPGFLDAAAVDYIVSMAPLDHPSLELAHSGSALVYRNRNALSRAYLVGEARAVPEDAMLDAMVAGDWDPRRTAFVPADAGIALPVGPIEGSVTAIEHTPDRVRVRATSIAPALLVLADNYYDGWRATVNGSEAAIHRVNHTFRGVEVGPVRARSSSSSGHRASSPVSTSPSARSCCCSAPDLLLLRGRRRRRSQSLNEPSRDGGARRAATILRPRAGRGFLFVHIAANWADLRRYEWRVAAGSWP